MDEEELYAGLEGVLLADDGDGACFLVSRLELAVEVSGVAVGRVGVEDARGVHDEGRPAEKLVRANVYRSCTSPFSFASKMEQRSDIVILLIL